MSRLPTLLMAALLALQGLLPLAARAAEPGVPAPIGMKLLDLPVPDGYVEVLRELPQLRVIGERMTPPGNRLLAATKVQVQTEGRTEEVPMAMAITTAVFKGKLLYFYAYAVYSDAADLDWLRGATRDWLPLAAASNAP